MNAHELIESGPLALIVCSEPDVALPGELLCTWINRDTGEHREQMVRLPHVPQGKHWRRTVEQRMARIPADEQVPYFLLRGIR